MQNPASEIPAMQAFQIGATPVIKQLIDKMQLMERIDGRSPIKKEECHLSVGTRIAALIINQLSERRKALYKVHKFYEKQDVELLFGPNVAASDFNDDALGRALDALYEAGLDNIYWEAAQGVQHAASSLSWGQLHFDTTSMIYTGVPKEPASDESDEQTPIKIVRGHSKDNQPQWPQIKIGMGTTVEGIPVFVQALDGNQDDKTWDPHMMKAVKKWLSPEQLKKAIFIADGTFVTKGSPKGVKQKDEPDLHFISRLPETFKVADTLKEKAWAANQWDDMGP